MNGRYFYPANESPATLPGFLLPSFFYCVSKKYYTCTTPAMKGRNQYFIQLRNQHLIKRYYFWYEIERKRRDDVIDILSNQEVFLDPEYIKHLLLQNNHLLQELRKQKPSAKNLDRFQFTTMPIQAAVQAQIFSEVA
jgi:hypothetical protein